MEKKNVYELELRPIGPPNRELIASCPKCKEVLAKVAWEGYHDYSQKRVTLKKNFAVCPKCQARFRVLPDVPKWEQESKGDLIAKCAFGDFRIWRYGSGYKWRYRTYGNLYADQVGFAATKDFAKSVCERHKEWRL